MLDEVVSEEDKIEQPANEDSSQDYDGQEEIPNDDIPDYAIEHHNYLSETDMPQRPIPELRDFRKDLKEQIHALLTDERQLMLGEYLIDSLNDEGLLEEKLSSIADDISFQNNLLISLEELEAARLHLLQLEPGGIGSTSIREFLLLQLHSMHQTRHTSLAIKLMENNFTDLTHRNMEKIAGLLGIEENELRAVLKLLSTLKLKPLAESSDPSYANAITIDFVVSQQDEVMDVSLYRQRSSTLFINHSLSDVLNKGRGDRDALQYLKSKLSSAQWFVSAIQQRETTMLNVMKAIVKFQTAYFLDGDVRLLKPMILKNIADTVGVHISTVSRITCNKYVDTSFGAILLKDLFSKGIDREQGEAVSNRVIQLAIEEVVKGESKISPYTDQQLVGVLAAKGYNIARRTVAKYRDQRQIPGVQVRALLGLQQNPQA